MALDDIMNGLRPDKVFIISDNGLADSLVEELRKAKVFDYVRQVSGKKRTGAINSEAGIQRGIYNLLSPAEAHGSGMGGKSVALILRDMEHLRVEDIRGLQTSWYDPGFTDFSSSQRRASAVFYVANGEEDMERFRNPFVFSPTDTLQITEQGITPLYTQQQLEKAYLRILEDRMEPEYFTFASHLEPVSLHHIVPPLFTESKDYENDIPIEKTLACFINAKESINPEIRQRFYGLLDAQLEPLRHNPEVLKTTVDDFVREYRSFFQSERRLPGRFSISSDRERRALSRFYNVIGLLVGALEVRNPNDPLLNVIKEQYPRLEKLYNPK